MKDKLQTVLTVSLVVFCSVIVQWNQRQTFKPICPMFCHVPCSTWAQRAWPSSSCACSFWVWCKTSSFSFWHHHAASEPGAEWTPEEREKKKSSQVTSLTVDPLKVLLLLQLCNSFFSAHLLNVVVGQRASIFKLLSSKDQPLLVRRDSCRSRNKSSVSECHCW